MYHGISASAGIGIGTAKIIREQSLVYTPAIVTDPDAEQQRFLKALDVFSEKTLQIAQRIEKNTGKKEAEILLGHIALAKDPAILDEIKQHIQNRQCAEQAVEMVFDGFAELLLMSSDTLTMQRVADLKDIQAELLRILLKREKLDLSVLEPDTVLVAKDLTPSMTAAMDHKHVAGIITESGGETSHSAILARSLEIPAVLSVENITSILKDGETVIVDGIEGVVFHHCDATQLSQYHKKQTAFQIEKHALLDFVTKQTKTADGTPIEIFSNIANTQEIKKVLEYGSEGIGLFRTEFLFMDRNGIPDEEEQFRAYQKAAISMKDKPVLIRTLDIGGDKEIAQLGIGREENPFLGFRAIRYCLANPELFRIQLRALLRASAFGNVRIMLPMVSSMEEVLRAKQLLSRIKAELDAEKIQYDEKIPLGVMIETPAAAAIADLLAQEVDFFSIGTNDLTQYTMAVDRGNSKVSYLYSAYHPALLRTIQTVISAGRDAGIPVGMCGEAAADPYLIPLFLAFGLEEFSVSPSLVLSVRKAISGWNAEKVQHIAEQVMKLSTEQAVRNCLYELIDLR